MGVHHVPAHPSTMSPVRTVPPGPPGIFRLGTSRQGVKIGGRPARASETGRPAIEVPETALGLRPRKSPILRSGDGDDNRPCGEGSTG